MDCGIVNNKFHYLHELHLLKIARADSNNFLCCQRDCRRNFKRPSMQKGQCPIHNGTLETYECSSNTEI